MRFIFMILLLFFMGSCEKHDLNSDQIMKISAQHYTKMLKVIAGKEKFPRTTTKDGTLRLVGPYDWTSGFFPGSLWYLYEFSKDEKWKIAAQQYTGLLEEIKNFTGNHDIGFMMYCSYGNGYRITHDQEYKKNLLQSARNLCTRFNPKIGCIRSWDWNNEIWHYPVIIDNMMNLELLMWAFKESNDSIFYQVAVSHANTTLKNHFRDDFSTYHVVDYDSISGEPRIKQTWQGLADSSAWARGQAWGLYGFTMMYRETGDKKYLTQAKQIARFMMNHPNLPADKIPFWDYHVSGKNEPRDASAAAITASALYDLSLFPVENKDKYQKFADEIITSLSSEKYLAQPGTNNSFILKHSVGAKPENKEVDVPLNYADYYFLEALLKKEKL